MNKQELKNVLELHKKYINEEGGEKANLSDADLEGADLSGADLRGADLSDADLCWADLSGADLRGADLSDADLSWAETKVIYLGQYVAYVQPDSTRIGCQYHTNDKWRNFSDKIIDKMSGDALDWWIDNKELVFCAMDSFKDN